MSEGGGTGWGVGQVLLVIAALAGLIVLAWFMLPATAHLVCAAIRGTTASVLTGATAVAASASTWIFLVGGGLGCLFLVNRVVQRARTRPFEWLLPVLSSMSGFLASLSKELYPSSGVTRVVFQGLTGLMFLGAGLLWRASYSSATRRPIAWRLLACLFYMVPFAVLIAAGTLASPHAGFLLQVGDALADSRLSLAGLAAAAVAITLLAYMTREMENE